MSTIKQKSKINKILAYSVNTFNLLGLKMLYRLKSLNDPKTSLLKDDPVRPEIPLEFRLGKNSQVLVLLDDQEQPLAVTCVRFKDAIPADCYELMQDADNPEVAVFYTIWSYSPGAGQQLLNEARSALLKENPNFKRFVTLSPKTKMAHTFHIKNGAKIFRENIDTINYEYTI